jgi:predicted phosphodiesterase
MRLYVMSDLHLEHATSLQQSLPTPSHASDVLVLAGDIVSLAMLDPTNRSAEAATHRAVFEAFRQQATRLFTRIIFVPGNHEAYGIAWETVGERLRYAFPEAMVLDNSSVVLDGVRFIGSTLWSDFKDGDADHARDCLKHMNDFNFIRTGKRMDDTGAPAAIVPLDVFDAHQESKAYIAREIDASTDPCVVITHHAPSMRSAWTPASPMTSNGQTLADGERLSSVDISGAFCSAMDDFIASRFMTVLWVHGHTHRPVDYVIGGTRVISNPRGYSSEASARDFSTELWADPLRPDAGPQFWPRTNMSTPSVALPQDRSHVQVPSAPTSALAPSENTHTHPQTAPRTGMSGSGSRSQGMRLGVALKTSNFFTAEPPAAPQSQQLFPARGQQRH